MPCKRYFGTDLAIAGVTRLLDTDDKKQKTDIIRSSFARFADVSCDVCQQPSPGDRLEFPASSGSRCVCVTPDAARVPPLRPNFARPEVNWRAHELRSRYMARVDQLRVETRDRQAQVSSEQQAAANNPPQMAAFFLVLFIFGQVTSTWALMAGHYAAWVTGIVFSACGITVALGSLIIQFHNKRRNNRKSDSQDAESPATLPNPVLIPDRIVERPVKVSA